MRAATNDARIGRWNCGPFNDSGTGIREQTVVKREEGKNTSATRMATFAEYQQMVERTDERRQRAIALMGLVEEIGDVLSYMTSPASGSKVVVA